MNPSSPMGGGEGGRPVVAIPVRPGPGQQGSDPPKQEDGSHDHQAPGKEGVPGTFSQEAFVDHQLLMTK